MIAGVLGNKLKLTSLDYFNLFGEKEPSSSSSVLIQEDAGFHLGISPDLEQTGDHVASELKKHYDDWQESGWEKADSAYKYKYFTIAVGGGNTVKAVYRSLLDNYLFDVEWLQQVRFFLLEESTGENKWESAEKSLMVNFIKPLCASYIRRDGLAQLLEKLELPESAGEKEIIAYMREAMVHGYDLAAVKKSLRSGEMIAAQKLIKKEAARYQEMLTEKLGDTLSFHQIITGIGKDGGIGAFSAYNGGLKVKSPGIATLKQNNGAIRIALNRGVLTSADQIYLIIAGSLKLRALGRFEMEDPANFERSVLETPIRMLRESHKLAEKVTIFADDRALHFDEDSYSYRVAGESFITKAETREGLEEDGIHILLLHGFMGLYTYMNLLVRLPSAWTVSALHRGSAAKKMVAADIFPHYAAKLRHAIIKNWKYGSPSPVGFHSIAGAISDHLLIAVVGEKGPIPPFDSLSKQDQQLINALRCGGMIQLATWAPSDIVHIEANVKNLGRYRVDKEFLDFGGPETIYSLDQSKRLVLEDFDESHIKSSTRFLGLALKIPGAEGVVNLANILVRYLMNNIDVHGRRRTEDMPYALRLVGGRMLKKVSFYGLFKEVIAALHDPKEYQLKHIRALEAIIEYDIPYIAIIHEDDFLVSANRHREEHNYLLQRRLEKESVASEEELEIPVRFVLATREFPDEPPELLNPHLMLMSSQRGGEKLSRQVTSAITRFVNENIHRATKRKQTRPLPSVNKWIKTRGNSKAP